MEFPTPIHEACGVFGMYDPSGADVASSIYYGLYALQHRGQESAGIAVTDTYGPKNKVYCQRGLGLVNEVFNEENLGKLKGNLGVGHVRYSTAGESSIENAQPLVLSYIKGTLIMGHNGNLVNAPELRRELSRDGAIFQTTIDSETIAYHIARERVKAKNAEEAVVKAMRKLKGAYALIIASPRKLIGARDPFGFKPLCIGKKKGAYIITSESCALETLGAEFVRDVLPGEIVTVEKAGTLHSDTTLCIPQEHTARCIFEYIYFCRPDSRFDGKSVTEARMQAGAFLAADHPVEADLVVGVPESGNMAALGYSRASGIPYGIAFTKNTYVGRTFIQPGQADRSMGVRIKLNVIAEMVKGKRIVMIDDSIVRGTTSAKIVTMLREAGATQVHMRVSAPPFKYPCYFGIDIPSGDQLIAHERSVKEIEKLIGVDSLGFLDIRHLPAMAGNQSICTACFNGCYPIAPPKEDIRGEYQH